MARPKKTVPVINFKVGLPEDLAEKVELHLFSEVEGKIPLGAKQEFFTMLVRGFFNGQG